MKTTENCMWNQSSADVQTCSSNTLMFKCLTQAPTSIENREALGGLCLVFAFAIIPKHLQVVNKRDVCSTVWCLTAALQPK